MLKQSLSSIKKVLVSLLVVLFVASLTIGVTSASNSKGHHHMCGSGSSCDSGHYNCSENCTYSENYTCGENCNCCKNYSWNDDIGFDSVYCDGCEKYSCNDDISFDSIYCDCCEHYGCNDDTSCEDLTFDYISQIMC